MLFVSKDLREEREELTHDNILRDDVILIYFFCENHGVIDVNKSENLFLQFFSIYFLNKKFILFFLVIC
jgi:hypothetical protein